MQLDEIQYLLEFNIWADGKMIDGTRHVSPEQLRAKYPMPFESIFDTLVHVMGAQRLWLTRWKGSSPPALTPPSSFKDLDDLSTAWDALHNELRAFMAGLSPAQLSGSLTYKDTKGVQYTHPLVWQIMHVSNHSTEHRSQVAAMIAMGGYDVGWIDIVYFMRNVSAPK
jgi:uncharacterized damage-inducible protein DinB